MKTIVLFTLLLISCLITHAQQKVIILTDSATHKSKLLLNHTKIKLTLVEKKDSVIKGKISEIGDSFIVINNSKILLRTISTIEYNRLIFPLRFLGKIVSPILFIPTIVYAQDGINFSKEVIGSIGHAFRFDYLYGFNLYTCCCEMAVLPIVTILFIGYDLLILSPAALGVYLFKPPTKRIVYLNGSPKSPHKRVYYSVGILK